MNLRTVCILAAAFALVVLPGAAHCAAPGAAPKPVYISISVSARECALLENGSGINPKAMHFPGKLREEDPGVYSCAVHIPLPEFERKLGVCMMRGHHISAGYEFYKGKPEARRHSCNVRPLADGNMYFHAEGIDADSCDWICFPKQ